MDVDRKPPITSANGDLRTNAPAAVRKDISLAKEASRPQTPNSSTTNKEPPQSPRSHRAIEDKQPRVEKVMPPPSAPSQTLSAQELRETAKQSIVNRPDKSDDRVVRSSNESRSQNGSANASPVPRRRSPSPSTRPGTRNGSADSRASGGRPRSDRESGDGNERLDDKKSNRDNRQESHGSTIPRRDSRSERGGRERNSAREEKEKEAERDRDRDRTRDRHGDKEKERERERDKDRRERDRDRERERERDRDRDRDRDRHRRDDKDRDRDIRKERELVPRDASANAVTPGPDNRGLPTRPDTSRHRDVPNGDEALGKRRRPADDEVG
jgi:THO complex subunit 2